MKKPHISARDPFEEPDTPVSPYDEDPEEDGLWFLSDPDDALDDHVMPLPQADTTPLAQAEHWIGAQGVHAAQLARAAMAVGQLDMLVFQIGSGASQRLALREVEAMTWAAGLPVPVEEIGRDRLQARASTDPQALQQARWALRRLLGEGDLRDLRTFLGLHRSDSRTHPDALRLRPAGDLFDEAAEDFHAAVAGLSDAHAFTRAAFARHLWQLSDLSTQDDQIEAAVWAARHMAEDCRALSFVPMGQGVRRPRTGVEGFRATLAAIETGASSALVELQRLLAWRDDALARSARIKGSNPAKIIKALVAKPMATTEMVEHAAGVSRDTAERLLARLAEMEIIREITGTRRFRIWAAKLR
jgi:hypothetical protein